MNSIQNTYMEDHFDLRPTHNRLITVVVFALCYGSLVLAIVASGLLLG